MRRSFASICRVMALGDRRPRPAVVRHPPLSLWLLNNPEPKPMTTLGHKLGGVLKVIRALGTGIVMNHDQREFIMIMVLFLELIIVSQTSPKCPNGRTGSHSIRASGLQRKCGGCICHISLYASPDICAPHRRPISTVWCGAMSSTALGWLVYPSGLGWGRPHY